MRVFATRLQLAATAALEPQQDGGEYECARCYIITSLPMDFTPTPFCNSCAQWALSELAEEVIEDAKVRANASDLDRSTRQDPDVAGRMGAVEGLYDPNQTAPKRVTWEPPGGLTRAKTSLRKRKR